ncbi:acyl-CoA thioester hydrolase [Fluviicoccus keumensis]|uniref:Acyl-CoA thioester hydrolase n=1 Tax=Fluviicoccus keumensis TaxID=1435465 RepID=A0A4Q7Z5K6_9GAMM|nr:thioesterase family protein [Fluviicoccus keumensis]RZU44983.1 acyl-CoA thioester hydrolase [Fluviicoccus keumensis]
MSAELVWKVSSPHMIDIQVRPEHQDEYRHTNNVAYLQWLEQAAWSHSNALGLDIAAYYRLGVGCVVRKHELEYLLPTHTGDDLKVGTWISANDGKLSTTREYQVIRVRDGKTVLTGKTHFITVDMASGKPKRMPREFVEAYRPAQ